MAKAKNEKEERSIGNQTGGRVFLYLESDDFWSDYHRMLECGIKFVEKPREENYGTVVVFLDLYGNKWDLIQKKPQNNMREEAYQKIIDSLEDNIGPGVEYLGK